MNFVIGFFCGLVGMAIAIPAFLGVMRFFGVYTTVMEGHCRVFTLFGKVIGVIHEPGISFLAQKLGPQAFLLPFFGHGYDVDVRLDQVYLRSQPVNSEEGTPMGIGVWYEMNVSDPVDFLFKNTDPDGSLRANVSNATVRSLSNMPLEDLLQNRHGMSRVVRGEVSPKSQEWGYNLGSVYIRKVHFRDHLMIQQIEEKVANRLRQVTAAIRQAGANQVEVIKSAAEKESATEFAKAATMRPRLVGETLEEISRDPAVLEALLEILRIDRTVKSPARLVLLPEEKRDSMLTDLVASELAKPGAAAPEHARPNPSGPSMRKGRDAPPSQTGEIPPEVPGDATPNDGHRPDTNSMLDALATKFGQGDRLSQARSLVDAYRQFKGSLK